MSGTKCSKKGRWKIKKDDSLLSFVPQKDLHKEERGIREINQFSTFLHCVFHIAFFADTRSVPLSKSFPKTMKSSCHCQYTDWRSCSWCERFICSKLIFICVRIAIASMSCMMQELLSSKVHFIVRLTTIGALLYVSVCVYRLIVKMRREGKGRLLSKRLCLCLCQCSLRNSPFLLPLSFSYLSAGGRVLLSPFSSLPSYLLFCSLFCHNNSSFQQLSSKFPSSKW